jgi:hypothetical protein
MSCLERNASIHGNVAGYSPLQAASRTGRLKLCASRVGYLISGVCFLAATTFAMAQPQNENASSGQGIVFDIPAQNLGSALAAYAATTGLQVLYETSLAGERTARAVKGARAPDAALRELLAGTGLVGRSTDVDAITIVREPAPQAAAVSVAPDERFLGALQASILNVLCRNADTRPGSYRMALQIWITPGGSIERAVLLSARGDNPSDAAFVRQLQGVFIGREPPSGMSQPITLAIVPRSPLMSTECDRP